MSTIVLDLEADRVLAAEVSIARGRARVVRAFESSMPEGFGEPGQADQLGAWIRERLDEAGMKSRSVVIAATRAEVLVKRLDVSAGSLSAHERHQMVHLQMSKQASLGAGTSVVDYVVGDALTIPDDEERGDGRRPGGGAEAGFVVASAMPAERVSMRTETARAAGLKLAGIRLRTAGVRALVSDELDADRPTLLANPSVGSVELLMLVGGQVVSSRSVAIDLPCPGSDESAYAERVAVEASRTLVSFRVMDHGGEIERSIVLAGGGVGSALTRAIGERLGLPAQSLDPATLVEFGDSVSPRLYPALAPLAGLLLCGPRGIRAHDFANPTRPPDTRAALRQGVLAAMLVLIVLGGAGYVLGLRAINDAERDRARAKDAYESAVQKYVETQLAGARLGHIRAWSDDTMNWPAHLETIVGAMPDAESVALGQVAVRLGSTPRFESGKQLSNADAWSAARLMSVSLGGVARDRAHIAELRQRLLDTGLYTVSSQGPEVEDRFAIQVATAIPSPVPENRAMETESTTPADETTGDAQTGDAR